MSTKRVAIRRPAKARVTPEVRELWQRLREIEADPVARNEWEPVGRHREYMESYKRLCTCLGLWWGLMISPLDTDTPTPRGYMLRNPIQVEAWRKAWEWRQVLEELP
jgi:hypothetical protein